MTYLGQPIGIAEYACRIAKGKSTHAIQILEWYPEQYNKIEPYHIDTNEKFREMELPTRDGQSRLSYETVANASKLYDAFRDLVEK